MRLRVLFAAAAALSMAGCPTETQTAGGDASRLAVNDALRNACSSFSESRLEQLLADLDSERQSGVTFDQQTQMIADSCLGEQDDNCEDCLRQAISQVYGQS